MLSATCVAGGLTPMHTTLQIHYTILHCTAVPSQSSVASDQMGHNVRREVEIQSKLRHPNIVSMPCFFQDSKTIYFVLDYAAGGDVYKVQYIPLHYTTLQHSTVRMTGRTRL